MAATFAYPAEPHARKHGPQGYADYASFRPWLRDEFAFCCIYCRTREQWGRAKKMFDLDHFVPQALQSDQEADYDNLLYACRICNGAKAHQSIPNPESCLTEDQVEFHTDGSIKGLTPGAEQIIWRLGLDDPEFRNWRLLWVRIVELAERYDSELYRQLMRFPDDLPNLKRLRPPDGNTRPEGIDESYFEMRECGELPDEY